MIYLILFPFNMTKVNQSSFVFSNIYTYILAMASFVFSNIYDEMGQYSMLIPKHTYISK